MASLIITKYHESLTTSSGIHIPYAFTYTNTLARETAAQLTVADKGKLARQLDNNTLWMLIDNYPPVWQGVGIIDSVASFDVDEIVTATISINGIDQLNYNGTELSLSVINEDGDIVTL